MQPQHRVVEAHRPRARAQVLVPAVLVERRQRLLDLLRRHNREPRSKSNQRKIKEERERERERERRKEKKDEDGEEENKAKKEKRKVF